MYVESQLRTCGLNSSPAFNRHPDTGMSRAFTLMELLIVMMIMTLLAGLALSALAGAMELAREQRTRVIITKIDQLIMDRYESYRTRAVPIRVAPGTSPRAAAELRLNALRELMRLELPDRISDLCVPNEYKELIEDSEHDLDVIPTQVSVETYYLKSSPSLALSYKRRARTAMYAQGPNSPRPWTQEHQGAECLYLILSTIQDGDKNALDYFTDSEIGDTDDDGQKEILDAWGTPILFLRWAPGYTIENGAATTQTSNSAKAPDPFDPAKADPWWRARDPRVYLYPYALKPLLASAGRDRVLDVRVLLWHVSQKEDSVNQRRNDPYLSFMVPGLGEPIDADDGGGGFADNITNHFVQTP